MPLSIFKKTRTKHDDSAALIFFGSVISMATWYVRANIINLFRSFGINPETPQAEFLLLIIFSAAATLLVTKGIHRKAPT